jgi:organic radical activating enzyme
MVYISRVECDVVDICNLRCKNCAHFADIYRKNIYSFEEFKKDITLLSKSLHIEEFYLMGGEPFLLGDKLIEYVNFIRETKICDKLGINTNGILLKKFSYIINSFDTIVISIYEHKHKQDILDWIEKNKNLYSNTKFIIRIIDEFVKVFDENNPKLTKEQAYLSWKNCDCKSSCNFIYKGKYYKCAQSIKIFDLLNHLNIKHEVDLNNNGVNLSDDNLEEKMENFIKSDFMLDACNYCRIGIKEKEKWISL